MARDWAKRNNNTGNVLKTKLEEFNANNADFTGEVGCDSNITIVNIEDLPSAGTNTLNINSSNQKSGGSSILGDLLIITAKGADLDGTITLNLTGSIFPTTQTLTSDSETGQVPTVSGVFVYDGKTFSPLRITT